LMARVMLQIVASLTDDSKREIYFFCRLNHSQQIV
jgi:hypothetical protein